MIILQQKVTKFRFQVVYLNTVLIQICKLGLEETEVIQQSSISQSLNSKVKAKRLTYREKAEIFYQISNGRPIKEIKELSQI